MLTVGWVFVDRDQLFRQFPESAPDRSDAPPPWPQLTPDELAVHQRLSWWGRRWYLGALAGLVLLPALAAAALPEGAWSIFAWPGFGLGAGLWVAAVSARRAAAQRSWRAQRARYEEDLRQRFDAWWQRLAMFADEEAARLSQLASWSSAQVDAGCRRVDIIGGNLWGWEAFLTVFGASALAARGPLLVIDLSGELVADELVRGAARYGYSTDFQVLPDDLAGSDLLAGLKPDEVAEIFVESLHGGQEAAGRGSRTVATEILAGTCKVLAPGGLSMRRIAEGLRALMAEPARGGILTAAERAALTDELFGAQYRQRAFDVLQSMAAMAGSVADLGQTRRAGARARLRCVAVSSKWRSGSGDFLADLIVGWVARLVSAGQRAGAGSGSAGPRIATLVIAGADDLAVRHVQRLSDLCDRRGVRLVTMYRHLRDTSLAVIGAGPVGFMRLGSHEEAARAADYIGREYRFKISGLTQTVGHEQSRGQTNSVGGSSGTDRSTQKVGLIGPVSTGRSSNVSRNWNYSASVTSGLSESQAQQLNRVYEYAVEPTVLQNLWDHAMVLVEHGQAGTRVRGIDVNPEIPALPPVRVLPPEPQRLAGPAPSGFPGVDAPLFPQHPGNAPPPPPGWSPPGPYPGPPPGTYGPGTYQ